MPARLAYIEGPGLALLLARRAIRKYRHGKSSCEILRPARTNFLQAHSVKPPGNGRPQGDRRQKRQIRRIGAWTALFRDSARVRAPASPQSWPKYHPTIQEPPSSVRTPACLPSGKPSPIRKAGSSRRKIHLSGSLFPSVAWLRLIVQKFPVFVHCRTVSGRCRTRWLAARSMCERIRDSARPPSRLFMARTICQCSA